MVTTDPVTGDQRPDDTTLVRAIRGVPGVSEAAVRRDADSGRTRLRLRLHAGEDHEHVAWTVAAVLRERFGIALDPAAIVPVPTEDPPRPPGPPPLPAAAASPETAPAPPPSPRPAARAARVGIASLDVHRDAQRLRVTVGLTGPQGRAEGVARAPGTQRGSARAVAEATVEALTRSLALPVAVAVDEVGIDQRSDPPRVTVALTLVADRGEEPLLGVAVVRDDAERAVARATLDALNRRVEHLLVSGGGSQG